MDKASEGSRDRIVPSRLPEMRRRQLRPVFTPPTPRRCKGWMGGGGEGGRGAITVVPWRREKAHTPASGYTLPVGTPAGSRPKGHTAASGSVIIVSVSKIGTYKLPTSTSCWDGKKSNARSADLVAPTAAAMPGLAGQG